MPTFYVTKPAIAVAMTLALVACEQRTVAEQAAKEKKDEAYQSEQKPRMISEHDGVRVWKVKDTTPGGSSYVYFTTRGDTFEQHGCGKGCIQRNLIQSQ
ncbi:hypothetical protein ABNQ39_20395 [Azospirillum sp. A26]|uniref:hypothetical protein n=1 Tax=Azospirillum sp. A26 TaxID=3160607 RepID=UPI00366CC210